MSALLREPLLFISIGGMTLVQAVLGLYTAFGGHLTVEQVTAINGFATVVLTILARLVVVPVSQLPAGTVEKMTAEKLANAKS